jgi:hypothetical protein
MYVIPKSQADYLLNSNYSRAQIEQALGLDTAKLLQGGDLVRIDVSNPFDHNLRMPDPATGNIYHRPDIGLTTGGFNESILNSPLKSDSNTITTIIKNK